MTFGNPDAAYLFVVPALFLIVFRILQRNKERDRHAIMRTEMAVAPGSLSGRERGNTLASVTGLSCMIIALMMPRWGLEDRPVAIGDLDVIVAIDTSKSMLADDVTPNRLAFAKSAAAEFAERLTAARIGLIAFAGGSFLQCPLTNDYGAFLLTLDSLDQETIPKGGTSLASAFGEAVAAFRGSRERSKVLIVMTDGDNLEPGLEEAVHEARRAGITVIAAGVGTLEGGLVRTSGGGILRDGQGRPVITKLQEDLLRRVAADGPVQRYYANVDGADLHRAVSGKESPRQVATNAAGIFKKQHRELFQIPAAIALVLLLAP